MYFTDLGLVLTVVMQHRYYIYNNYLTVELIDHLVTIDAGIDHWID